MHIVNWLSNLEGSTYDDLVGIKLTKLAGNSEFSTYLTVIDSGKSVRPHYHKSSNEHYHIILGHGEIALTDLASMKTTITAVGEQTSFTVPERTLHPPKNSGKEPLMLMFSCPQSHLNENRFLL